MRFAPRLWRRPPSRQERSAMALACRKVSGDLRRVARDTEKDFLAVGGELERLLALAGLETDSINSLLKALGGESADSLGMALDEVTFWADAAREGHERSSALAGLLPIVVSMRGPLQELAGASRMLRVTGTVTRVESSRLGKHADGFLGLAAEVAALAADIEEKSESVLAAVHALHLLIDRTRQTVVLSEQVQNRDLLLLLDECREALFELHSGQERIAVVSLRAQKGYQKVLEEVGRVVVALQFHDSTRQRLEHVGESLEGLAERIDTSDPPAGTAALIHLQRAQIEEARRTFLDSVARIRTDLGAMHAETADLVRVARDVNGENSGNKADAAKGVVGHCAAVVAALDEWSSSRRSLGEATGQVADGCARVGAFVSDIQNVGTRLLRLALNAQVEAVRLSDSGAVMEAVAEGIRSVSQQASSHAQHAGEALALAQEAVNGFAGGLGANDKASCGAAEIAAGRIRGLGGGLADSAARSGQLMAAILQNGEELSHSIAELIHGLTADSVMGQVVDRCLETLIEVEKLAGRVTPRHCPDGALESQPGTGAYTMQDERAVHAATTGRTAEASGAAQDAVDQSVELF